MFSQLGHNHCPRIRRYSTQKFAHEIQRVQAQTYMGKCWIGAIARAPSQWRGGGIWSEWAGGETLQLLKANFCKSGGPLKCY